ncbi:unnamed protein product [Fraxinus pennsylvanica]|uniref:NAD(P)H dehydrogenase (quinone) n=1 Tax=Fraxinus pennsylvanica TaxID=56036 RepID=A0AAD2DUB1_9LAMI|nr:unnamed protein product [Fraxinus pennsylvanica]
MISPLLSIFDAILSHIKIDLCFQSHAVLALQEAAEAYLVPETLPYEVLMKTSTPPRSDVPMITPSNFPEADGFVFGFPTRFEMMAAQFKAFVDATRGLRRTRQLAGNLLGSSTESQGGGQETTA